MNCELCMGDQTRANGHMSKIGGTNWFTGIGQRIELKSKVFPSPENLSTKVGEKESICIIERA